MPAFVFVFYLGMKRCEVEAMVVVRAEGRAGSPTWNVPNAARREMCHFRKGRKTGFPMA